jgi:N-acetylmuramoyl-L-alanine amidase
MKICIDAGHNCSRFDTGAEGNGLREQDITYKISSSLKSLFNLTEIPIIMTRKSVEDNLGKSLDDSLNQRVKIANNYNCDLFISIHCNSSTNESTKGTETLISARGGQAEKLAKKVNAKLVKKIGLADRGVKVDNEYLGYNLKVLEKTKMPAILIETAFISNANDALLLKEHYDGFAEAIYEAICEYYKIEPVATQKKPLENPTDIIDKLSHQVTINDKLGAISALEKAKSENTSLYWILYKIANK